MLVLTGGPAAVTDLWFDPGGRAVCAIDADSTAFGRAVRWQLDGPSWPTLTDTTPPPVGPVRVGPVGHGANLQAAYLLGTGPAMRVTPLPPWVLVWAVAVLADGERFAAVERSLPLAVASDCWLVVRTVADAAEQRRVPFVDGPRVRLAAVPGTSLVVGNAAAKLGVWDCDTGTHTPVAGRVRRGFRDLAAHPDGRQVLAVNGTPHVTVVYPHAARVAGQFAPGVGDLTAVACSPDGLLWAAAGDDGRVAVWDVDG